MYEYAATTFDSAVELKISATLNVTSVEQIVHQGLACRLCFWQVVQGYWHKCMKCNTGHDLCQACWLGNPNHEFHFGPK
jgi:hypothetical protein